MILYVLKSTTCLLVLFGIYKLFLEKEKMHTFNRFYLLGSLVFALLIPFFPFKVISEIVPSHELGKSNEFRMMQLVEPSNRFIKNEEPTSVISIVFVCYLVIAVILLVRFLRNLIALINRINRGSKRFFEGAILVLTEEQNSPYTFLRYIFVNKEVYENPHSEPELFTHELTHVRQNHSFDVLILEILVVFLWFNPVLFWFRKAVKLNHEFLADLAVNATFNQVATYQQLLLSKITHQPIQQLSSSFIFQTTKQRLLMMTKTTSQVKALILQTAVIMVIPILILTFSETTSAQETKGKPTTTAKSKLIDVDKSNDDLYKDVVVYAWSSDKKNNQRKKYSELTPEEKKSAKIIPPDPRKSPTESQLNDWKNPDTFGIWLDGKRIKNDQLNRYKTSDIVAFSGSYVHKNARNFGKHHYQFDLMTETYYAAYLEEHKKSPLIILVHDTK